MREPLSMDEIRRRALRAAAAAAGASLLACSGADTSGGGPASTNQPDTNASVDVGAGGDSAVADSGASSADSTAVSDTGPTAKDSGAAAQDVAIAQDTAKPPADTGSAPVDSGGAPTDAGATKTDTAAPKVDVASAADTSGCPDPEPGEPDCIALQGKPEWATCCDDRNKWCATKHANGSKEYNECVFGPNFSGKCTGCIPWGPPAPPRFDLQWRPRAFANGEVFAVA